MLFRSQELAASPNVTVKLGGLNSPRLGMTYIGRETPPTSAELVAKQKRVILSTIDLFGPERCMFESNFPMDMRAASYGIIWNAFKKIVADFTEAEKQLLFSETAQRIYRLGDSGSR